MPFTFSGTNVTQLQLSDGHSTQIFNDNNGSKLNTRVYELKASDANNNQTIATLLNKLDGTLRGNAGDTVTSDQVQKALTSAGLSEFYLAVQGNNTASYKYTVGEGSNVPDGEYLVYKFTFDTDAWTSLPASQRQIATTGYTKQIPYKMSGPVQTEHYQQGIYNFGEIFNK
ncbi:hypothetical protein [Lentilactobacillus otakiensis]|uniref:hypothetical protein n=1 Tax=Lentilactobacillus otakiensis TaxID=481720 RepID=UPI003D163F0D